MIEYLSRSIGGMLCSHSVRDGPASRYAERGAAMIAARCHLPPCARRNLNRHGETSEMPTTSAKTGLSRCYPMAAPDPYSVTRTYCKSPGPNPAKSAARRRSGSGSRNGGMSSAF